MERDVSRWLSHTFGYQTAADARLPAACRGNLRALWEFLMTNYKSTGQKHSIVNVLDKHRRDQEAAKREPELRQMAQQQRQLLLDLQHKAEMLERTLASFQGTTENAIVDSMEQHGECGLLQQDLHEPLAQVCLLREYAQQLQQFLPLLQARLSNLQTVAELARTRCYKTASQKRLQHLLQQLQQVKNRIRTELLGTLEGKQPDTGNANDLDQLHQPDQQQALLEYRSTDDAGPAVDGSSSSNTWEIVPAQDVAEPNAAAPWQSAGRNSIVSNYTPSEAVKYSAMQLLQEPPESLLSCSSQLAAQASHQLTAVLDEAERALLAPLGGEAGQSQGFGLEGVGRDGMVGTAATDNADPYTLPWTTSGTIAGLGGLASSQQQRSGYVTPEMLVKERQKAHVDMYMQTMKAQAAVQAVDKELTLLLGSTPLLQQHLGSSNWEAQLAGLWLRAERLQGEVGLLEQRKQDFERDVDDALKAESRLQETWEHIQATVREDQELNKLLSQVSSDNLDLYISLCGQQDEVLQQLKQQLVPFSSAAAHNAQAAKDEVRREVATLDQVQITAIGLLQTLSAQRAAAGRAGAPTAECQAPTLVRLEAAAQRLSHMGRPTTAVKTIGAGTGIGRHGGAGAAALSMSLEGLHGSSRDSVVDSAAVSALREAAAVNEVAPVLCPAALLTEVAGECHRLRQLQQQLEQLDAVYSTAVSHGRAAEQQTALLRTQVTDLRSRDREEVLPLLDDLLDQNQSAVEFVRNQMPKEVNHWREQPAHCLLKECKYDGKNCEQWLTEVQCLHAKKRQLSGQQV